MSRHPPPTEADESLRGLRAHPVLVRGSVLAGRYVIGATLGKGGTGQVFRAFDRATRTDVALKIVRPEVSGRRSAFERLGREVRHAREVQHRNVCRVFDLSQADGFTFLTMELATLGSLRRTLRSRGRAALSERVADARALAAGLAAIHAAGIIHRDLKPENILRMADGRLVVSDFGLAREVRNGGVDGGGTRGYVAPEVMAGGAASVLSDIWSLGVVIRELFSARVASEQTSTFRTAVTRLCNECRSELASARPPAVAAVLARLDELSAAAPAPSTKSGSATVLVNEQRIACVVVGRVREELTDTLKRRAESSGGEWRRRSRLTFEATFRGEGTPSDLVSAAARFALATRDDSGAALAIGIGRLATEGLRQTNMTTRRTSRLLATLKRDTIALDSATASLLNPRFEVSKSTLVREAGTVDRPRTVLGRIIPCVGRDRELSTLIGLWHETADEPIARCLLVTAPAGGGKSRLRHEFVERIGRDGGTAQVLIGRGDALRAGAPFAMLGPALRTALGLIEGESNTGACGRMVDRVRSYAPASDAKRVAAFLGEVVGVTFPDGDLPSLRRARLDPRLMAEQTLAAWLDFVEGFCKAGPVLLVLEDMHWGDAPSIHFVDAALRSLRERPLMVLALGRPDVDEAFPKLWCERNVQRMALPPLTSKSARELVGHAGVGLLPDQVAWIVERADGNPFCLEELIRAAHASAHSSPPEATPKALETVTGMVAARLDGLGTEAKRVLRAAAILGRSFRAEAVRHLLGANDVKLARCLDLLVSKEVLIRRASSSAEEFAFRHALLHEAAYLMLTDSDRERGHLAAGEHLEQAGEREAILLVEHFARGGDRARAARWCRVAAEQAFRAGDLAAAAERARRGVRLGAHGDALDALHLIVARTSSYLGKHEEASHAARRALGSSNEVRRLEAAAAAVLVWGFNGQYKRIERLAKNLLRTPPGRRARGRWLEAMARTAGWLVCSDADGFRIAEEILHILEATVDLDEGALGADVRIARCYALHRRGHYAQAVTLISRVMDQFSRLDDTARTLESLNSLAVCFQEVGQHEQAEPLLRGMIVECERRQLRELRAYGEMNLAIVLAFRGSATDARSHLTNAEEYARAGGASRFQAMAHVTSAMLAEQEGDVDGLIRSALLAERLSRSCPTKHPVALAMLARAHLATGQVRRALEYARKASTSLSSAGWAEDGEAPVRVTLIRCLLAASERDLAQAAIVDARAYLDDRGAAIGNPAWARTFRTRIPDHALIDRLFREHCIESAVPSHGQFLPIEVRSCSPPPRPRRPVTHPR